LSEKLERHEIFNAAQQSYIAARLKFCLFVCLFVYERCMRACAAKEAIDTRAYNTVKRNGGLVRSSGRPVVRSVLGAFLLLPWKKKFL
jgi:hypothetical protein